MSDIELQKGVVLAIPIEKRTWALGQIIEPGVSFFIGVIPIKFEEPLTSGMVLSGRMKLFSWTNDAEIFRGNWKILGKEDIDFDPQNIEYLVNIDGKLMVESFDGKKLREYSFSKDEKLTYRKARSPLIVQDAVQAALGLGDWKVTYDQMLMNTAAK